MRKWVVGKVTDSTVEWVLHGQGRQLVKKGLGNAFKAARTCLRKASLNLVMNPDVLDSPLVQEYVNQLKSNPTLIVNCNVKCVVIYMLH